MELDGTQTMDTLYVYICICVIYVYIYLDLQTSTNFWWFFSIASRNLPIQHFLSFHWLSLIQKKTGRTTSAISRNRAQFPANEHTFEKWLFSNLAVPRAEIGKTSRFGFLEQKFARAEISVLLKLQVYIYGPVLVASDITSMGWSSPVLSPILPPPSDSPCWRLPPRHCPHSQSLGLSKSVAVTTGWTQM